MTFPFRAAARFTDLESADDVIADPARVRDEYLARSGGLHARYERELRGAGVDYVQLDTTKPLDFGAAGLSVGAEPAEVATAVRAHACRSCIPRS